MYTYQPKRALLTKNLISVIFIFLLVWVSTWVPMFFIMKEEGPENYWQASLFWSTVGNLVWALPVFLTQWPVFKRYRYELLDDEIVVHSGWIVQKVRHVPYRMVTNIEIRRGLIDRWLGIGNLSIDTAGNSDPNARPEAQFVRSGGYRQRV